MKRIFGKGKDLKMSFNFKSRKLHSECKSDEEKLKL